MFCQRRGREKPDKNETSKRSSYNEKLINKQGNIKKKKKKQKKKNTNIYNIKKKKKRKKTTPNQNPRETLERIKVNYT